MVVVVRDAPNNYAGPVTVDVQLDRKKLGLPAGGLVSMELESLGRNTKGVVDGDVLKVPVDVDDFSAVIIKSSKAIMVIRDIDGKIIRTRSQGSERNGL